MKAATCASIRRRRWNREGDRFAFPALAKDGTRQMFEVHVIEKK